MSAAEDAQQVVVLTIQKSVYGKDVAVKAMGNQLLGQMSLQQLSQHWATVLLDRKEGKEPKDTVNFS